MGITLWIIQVLLALLFVGAGIRKLQLSQTALTQSLPELSTLPLPFVRFIGIAELLAAIGLTLPAATRIAPILTPAAAAGLVLLMAGATVYPMYAVKRPRLILALMLLNVAVALLVALLGALSQRPRDPAPHELCRAPVSTPLVDGTRDRVIRVGADQGNAPVRLACVVPLPIPVPTLGGMAPAQRATWKRLDGQP
jgi:hypothetical protein